MIGAQGRLGRLVRWLPAVAVMALIFALSSVSGLRISDDAAIDRPARMLAHFGIYALLGALLLVALWRGGRPSATRLVGAFVLALLYAVSDEIHQAMVPERSAQVGDLIIDALGASAGVLAAAVLLGRHGRAPVG